MQKRDHRRKKIVTLEQARCLASPARTELLDALGMVGEGSAHDLACITGLSVNTIHYHLDKLSEAGLVRKAGTRPTATKGEGLFRLQYERMGFDLKDKSIEYREAKSKAIRQSLNLAQKESDLSLFSDHGMDGAKHLRVSVKLSRKNLRELRSRLVEVAEWARSRHDDECEPVSITALTVLKAP